MLKCGRISSSFCILIFHFFILPKQSHDQARDNNTFHKSEEDGGKLRCNKSRYAQKLEQIRTRNVMFRKRFVSVWEILPWSSLGIHFPPGRLVVSEPFTIRNIFTNILMSESENIKHVCSQRLKCDIKMANAAHTRGPLHMHKLAGCWTVLYPGHGFRKRIMGCENEDRLLSGQKRHDKKWMDCFCGFTHSFLTHDSLTVASLIAVSEVQQIWPPFTFPSVYRQNTAKKKTGKTSLKLTGARGYHGNVWTNLHY